LLVEEKETKMLFYTSF